MSKDFTKVNDFKIGETVYGNFLVKSIQNGKTVANKPFMDIEIGDKTGSIIAKLWDVTFAAESLVAGDVAYATGEVKSWNGSPQLKLDHIEIARQAPSIIEFVPTAPYSQEEMAAIVEEYITEISHEEMKNIVIDLYDKNKVAFLEAPAAMGMHHAIHAGLAYHTMTMLQSAESLSKIYTFLNRDLLYAGIILHDLAKVYEMEYQHGNASGYTRPGFLLGHIVQGTLMIDQAGARCQASQRTIETLQHLVVSHHEKGEWGSPQPPKMAEAMMIHFIDNIDAKMYMAKELIEGKPEGEYTEYHKGIRNKLFVF